MFLDNLQNIYQWILIHAEIIGTLIGMPFFIFIVLEKPIAWVFGSSSSLFLAITNFQLGYIGNGFLMLYYFIIGVYGFYLWIFVYKDNTKNETTNIPITVPGNTLRFIYVIFSIVFSAMFYMIFYKELTISNILDSLTLGFSIVASYMQARKQLDNWFYWIIINFVYILMYVNTGSYYYTTYSLLAFCIALYGLYNWKKIMLRKYN